MYIYFLNVNIYLSTDDYLFKYYYLVYMLRKVLFLLSHLSAISNLNLADFTTPNNHQRF